MLGSGLLLKASTSLFSKIFEKLVNNVFVDNLEKYGLYLISSMVLSSDSTSNLLGTAFDSTAWALNRLGLHQLWHLIYPRLSTRSDMVVSFTNLSLFSLEGLGVFSLDSLFLDNCPLSISRWEVLKRMSCLKWCFLRLHSWSYAFPNVHL